MKNLIHHNDEHRSFYRTFQPSDNWNIANGKKWNNFFSRAHISKSPGLR